MINTTQLNIRITPERRKKLLAIAAGEGVSLGKAVALLLDNTPVEPVERPEMFTVVKKNNRQAAANLAETCSMAVGS